MQRWFRYICYIAAATGMAATIGCGCDARPVGSSIDDDVIRHEVAQGDAWDHLPESKDGPDKLVGTWEIVRFEAFGVAYPELALAQMRRAKEFRGVKEFKFVLGPCWCQFPVDDDDGKPSLLQLPISVLPELSPHQFEFVGVDGELVGGIYKLTNDDRLLIAIRDDEGQIQSRPPRSFDSSVPGTILIVCKRVVPPSKPPD